MDHFSTNKSAHHTSEQPQQPSNTSDHRHVLSVNATVPLDFCPLTLLCKFILISVSQSSILIKVLNIAHEVTATQEINCLNELLI